MSVSRRKFISTTGVCGAFLLARFQGLPGWAADPLSSPCQFHTGYAPFIDSFREHLQPGGDGFITELYAAELESILDTWRASLCSSPRDLRAISSLLPQTLDASALGNATLSAQRAKPPIACDKAAFPHTQAFTSAAFLATLAEYLAPIEQIEVADFQVYGIEIVTASPCNSAPISTTTWWASSTAIAVNKEPAPGT